MFSLSNLRARIIVYFDSSDPSRLGLTLVIKSSSSPTSPSLEYHNVSSQHSNNKNGTHRPSSCRLNYLKSEHHPLRNSRPVGSCRRSSGSIKTAYNTSITTLLASPHRPVAAIICTPNSTHVPLSLELIAAGIHVLVEKPISTTIEEGQRLVEAAKGKGVKLLVGHHRRFNPYLLAAKKVVDDQELGRIIAIQGSWSLLKPDSYFDAPTE